ncbi:MAG: hypothetical protein ACXWAT_00845 [Methylobacter sp.]
MAIQNFPAALQPIIQTGFLERAIQDGLESMLGYDQVADVEPFPNQIGETITKTRNGLKAPVTTPLTPGNNTNLDNGLTAASWTVEQYSLSINQYADTIDLNVVTQKVGIADQFLKNAKVNAIQAVQSRDRIARNTLFNAYMGQNTRVRTTLGSPAATINVDDVRGFGYVFSNGVLVPVSGSATMSVVVGSNAYTLTGVAADVSNVSTAPGGISGTLTFSGNVTVADATTGNGVSGQYAPTVLRPNARNNTSALVGTDLLTMGLVLDGVAQLRNNAVPTINGYYNLYLDNKSARQIFADNDFKLLFQGQSASAEFAAGKVIELLDVRFIPTTEAYQQTLGAVNVRRPILCGEGALVRGDFSGSQEGVLPENSEIIVKDGIYHVTREPLDRLQQIVAQSWFWIGGYAAPTDSTANTTIIPTASSAYYKRAVLFETA